MCPQKPRSPIAQPARTSSVSLSTSLYAFNLLVLMAPSMTAPGQQPVCDKICRPPDIRRSLRAMLPAPRSCAGSASRRRRPLYRDGRLRPQTMPPEPCVNDKADRTIVIDNQNASHNGSSRRVLRSTRRGIDYAMIFFATNQCVVLIFALDVTGCLPARMHWNNFTTLRLA
jgi:hypothetical protein